MDYGVSYLSLVPGASPAVLPQVEAALPAMSLRGKLLGCFYSEIGELNQIALIHGYADARDFAEDERVIDTYADPFGISDVILARRADLFRLFPGEPAIEPGAVGPFFEFRTYRLRPKGLPATMEAWSKALPERKKHSSLVAVMHALTGEVPRFMHIWPYVDLAERTKIRTRTVELGVWPPKGGIGHIQSMRSEIFLAAPFSPLH